MNLSEFRSQESEFRIINLGEDMREFPGVAKIPPIRAYSFPLVSQAVLSSEFCPLSPKELR